MQNQNNKKTILYLITQSELGGAQRYIFDLAENLRNEFNIAVAVGEQGATGELVQKLKEEKFKLSKINKSAIENRQSKIFIIPHLKRAISPIKDLKALIEIIKLIKKLKPDIIHLNSSKISILGSISKLFLKILTFNSKFKIQNSKFIYTVHGWVFNEPLPIWKKLFYKYTEKFTAILKDKIICVSEFDKQTAIKEKICNPKKLITIHNGIKPINFLPQEQARQKLFSTIHPLINKEGGLGGEVIIGSIGNLYKTKGFEYLIQAAKILKEKFLILIIGEGPERKNLEQLIKRYQLQNHIILTGKIDNAAELLPAFDIYACSSIKEGLSYTIIEAMQAGLPIVATKVGGNPELIIDNKTGLLTELKNTGILAKKIQELINNPELRQKLGKQAKIKSRENFNLEKMIKETRKVYKN
ncbi:MAG: glycosyltransferase family 4 protein [Patescibacteria group bacterium]|nr:glycosyltransferase family 4 protein [Patescibacteria group bacterium]